MPCPRRQARLQSHDVERHFDDSNPIDNTKPLSTDFMSRRFSGRVARVAIVATAFGLLGLAGCSIQNSVQSSLAAQVSEPSPVGTVVIVTVGTASTSPTSNPILQVPSASTQVTEAGQFRIELVMSAPTLTPTSTAPAPVRTATPRAATR